MRVGTIASMVFDSHHASVVDTGIPRFDSVIYFVEFLFLLYDFRTFYCTLLQCFSLLS